MEVNIDSIMSVKSMVTEFCNRLIKIIGRRLFVEVYKKPIIVAVIDSGIDFSNPILNRSIEKSIGFIRKDNGLIVEENMLKSRHEHATIIALIIKKLCNNVRFINVNILDEMLMTNGNVLIKALEEAIKDKPDIIHLSLGTTKWRYNAIN